MPDQKIVSHAEIRENIKKLSDAEMTPTERFVSRHISRHFRNLSIALTNVKTALSKKARAGMKQRSQGLDGGIYRDEKNLSYYDENVAKYAMSLGEKFAAAVCGKKIAEKETDIRLRAVAACTDCSDLKKNGKLKLYRDYTK